MVQGSYGFYLLYANDNTIDGNLVSNNDWGIYLYDSDRNTLVQNSFAFNAYGLDVVSYSTSNTIAWNDILNNTLQMHQDSTSGGNTWNKMTGGTAYGNYWSNYTGDDIDDPPDGVGDTLLPHMGVDYYPLINPWNTVHDPAVVSVTTSDTAVYQGHIVNVTVVVRNEGTATETFDVTAKYFNRPIGTKQVTNLAPLRTTTLVFRWNTTSMPLGFHYDISAEIELIIGETDSFDNTYVDGDVHVKIPGDIDGDNMVGSADASVFNGAYGTSEGDPLYVRAADFNLDGYIGSADAGIFNNNYGKTC